MCEPSNENVSNTSEGEKTKHKHLWKYIYIFPWYWITMNSTVFNSVEEISIKIDKNHWANLIFSFWWNENNTVEITDNLEFDTPTFKGTIIIM